MKNKLNPGDKVICIEGTKDDSDFSLVKGAIYTIARYEEGNGEEDMVALVEKGNGKDEIYFAKRFRYCIEAQCLELEHFIRRYTPHFWKETIETVCFIPSVMPKDYIAMQIGEIPGRFDKWYFKEAIKEYFKSKSS